MLTWNKALFALVITVVLSPSVAYSSDRPLQFSEFEQQVWSLLTETHYDGSEDVLQHLISLLNTLKPEETTKQALVLTHICRYSSDINQPFDHYIELARQLENTDIYQNGATARYRCEEQAAFHAGDYEKVAELATLAYESLTPNDLPALVIWISYDYIEVAFEAGLYDKATEATVLSLRIAQANNLTEWEGETLARLALIQHALGNDSQALETNSKALETVTTEFNRLNILANQAFILKESEQLAQAEIIYQQLLDESAKNNTSFYLIAGINLIGIYQQQERYSDSAKLLATLYPMATEFDDKSFIAYLDIIRAHEFLTQNKIEEATQAFQKGRQWFETNQMYDSIVDSLSSWAQHLHLQGKHAQAYLALQDKLALQQRLDLARRTDNALLSNALLTAEQQKRELLESRLQQEQAKNILLQKQLQQRLTLAVLAATALLGGISLFAYWRLRRVNTLLAIKNQQLDYESTHDPLTKVFNRRYFYEFIAPKLEADPQALLLLMDIDHFKHVNDTYGHSAGDEVLRIISKRLSNRLKDTDRIIRWGGEEFLLYIETQTEPEQCAKIIQRILAEVESTPIQLENTEIRITISIGFSVVRFQSQAELEAQLNSIDTMLYQAKNTGRNRAFGTFIAGENPVSITAV